MGYQKNEELPKSNSSCSILCDVFSNCWQSLSLQGGGTTHNLGQLGSDGSLAGTVVADL